jgi:hypothetical protein
MNRSSFSYRSEYQHPTKGKFLIIIYVAVVPAAADTELPNMDHLKVTFYFQEIMNGFFPIKGPYYSFLAHDPSYWYIGKAVNQDFIPVQGHFVEWLKNSVLTEYEKIKNSKSDSSSFETPEPAEE